MFLRRLSLAFGRARGTYEFFVPSPVEVLIPRYRRVARGVLMVKSIATKAVNAFQEEFNPGRIAGQMAGGMLLSAAAKKPRKIVRTTLKRAEASVQKKVPKRRDPKKLNERHLVNSKRTWLKPGRAKVSVIFHDANKAKMHLDVHFSNGTSFIVRVSGKPVESEVKYNNKGQLTQNAKKALMKHLRAEIAASARVPQNYDHNPEEAHMTWNLNDGPADGEYGSGPARQLVAEDDVYVLHVKGRGGKTAEMYAPILNPHAMVYTHKLYSGNGKSAPIVIMGSKKTNPPKLYDRLKLKYIPGGKKAIETYKDKIDPSTNTEKIDGAACHVVVTPKGTRVYSHRVSKTTGTNIEYTGKIPEIANLKGTGWQGMGEMAFYKNGKRMKSGEIAGILNSDKLRPEGVTARIHLYRADKVGSTEVFNYDFWLNRALQERIASRCDVLEVVPLVDVEHVKGTEGLVGVPHGESVNKGIKIKWDGNTNDWRIDKIGFHIGPKGSMAGYVTCTSLESGKEFKLGPGMIGDVETCLDFMNNPEDYIGRVAKVASKEGHEGRSAKWTGEWHTDKGTGR